MGYSNVYYGAFRITPKIDPLIACRLNLWLNSRHFRRYRMKKELQANFDIEDETIFGTVGADGEFVIPSFRTAWTNLMNDGMDPFLAPHLMGLSSTDLRTDEFVQMIKDACKTNPTIKASLMSTYSLCNCKYYNSTPGKIFSLWSDLCIINDPDNDVSYLSWTNCEKSYHMKDWFRTIVGVFQVLGYVIDGSVTEVCEDGGEYHFSVKDGCFIVSTVDAIHTYEDEAAEAQKRSEVAAKDHTPEGEIDLSLPGNIRNSDCISLSNSYEH